MIIENQVGFMSLVDFMCRNPTLFQVDGHLDYRRKLTEVLQAVGLSVTPHSIESVVAMSQAAAKNQKLESPAFQMKSGTNTPS